jgi:hypothetical protein
MKDEQDRSEISLAELLEVREALQKMGRFIDLTLSIIDEYYHHWSEIYQKRYPKISRGKFACAVTGYPRPDRALASMRKFALWYDEQHPRPSRPKTVLGAGWLHGPTFSEQLSDAKREFDEALVPYFKEQFISWRQGAGKKSSSKKTKKVR